MTAIFGSGFGLYGYIPAMLKFKGDQKIGLPFRYREKFAWRKELSGFTESIAWINDESELLEQSSEVIIAKRPMDQPELISSALKHANVRRLFLEKPLAVDPQTALRVFAQLTESGKTFRISYLFRFTEWADDLRTWLRKAGSDGRAEIKWSFMAHHYANNLQNWKRSSSAGGGALRFYGIHLIALMADFGYTSARASNIVGVAKDEAVLWTCELSGKNLPAIHLKVDSRASETQFGIWVKASSESWSLILKDPFAVENTGEPNLDGRTEFLKRMLEEGFTSHEKFPSWYRSALELWRAIELATPELTESRL